VSTTRAGASSKNASEASVTVVVYRPSGIGDTGLGDGLGSGGSVSDGDGVAEKEGVADGDGLDSAPSPGEPEEPQATVATSTPRNRNVRFIRSPSTCFPPMPGADHGISLSECR
jgi:hypothetical protein